jgi:hypothetical protein
LPIKSFKNDVHTGVWVMPLKLLTIPFVWKEKKKTFHR